MKNFRLIAITAILALLFPSLVEAKAFLAYSMGQAQKRLLTADRPSTDVRELGGITRIAGMVYDRDRQDLIIVGQVIEKEPKLTLDDLVVAMRAVLVHQTYPLVSIDRTVDTATTGKQVVRFEGGVGNTKFGNDMLQADVTLKRIALGRLSSEVWGVKSYFSMTVEQAQTQGNAGDNVGSRFWFYPVRPSLAVRDGVFAIMELDVGVETEVLSAEIGGKPVQDLSRVRDEIGDRFSHEVEMNLADLTVGYPELSRARPLLAMVALAEGIKSLQTESALGFWLNTYKVERVESSKHYDLIEVHQEIQGRDLTLTLSGGIELNPIGIRLEAGDVTALREAVLKARPSQDALVWDPPLEGWHIPGTEDIAADYSSTRTDTKEGFSLDRVLTATGQTGFSANRDFPGNIGLPSRVQIPTVGIEHQLPAQRWSPNVGGVLLQGSAAIAGSKEARVDVATGQFSLIVEGQRARLAPETFRKFITALWAVYFSKEDPGVSIDPIAPGVDKHLVRYIGKVVNTDLGRVMREADYLMKRWAVGTEQPDIRGFHNVDDLSATHGLQYVGASRRFWFVPEAMRFRRGGDLLLFDNGRMTLKTEYVLQNKEVPSEPADQAFAAFFTQKYHEAIVKRYPVYQELFEYAKMVSLAKYLKDSGVPLFWFLMANKDLVITEDSPGTVDALVRGSRRFEGLTIEGGVDLGVQGQYVMDASAARAVEQALAKVSSKSAYGNDALGERRLPNPGSPSLSFDVDNKNYSVAPYHTLTSGKDVRGIRYQTDFALRTEHGPGLELVRYYNPREPDGGEFGRGWHLLVPYRIKPVGDAKREFLNVRVPQKMLLQNLVSGDEEVLTFSTDRYSLAGYVPDKLASSQAIGLFLMSDASYRLADKLGNEFWFDAAGYLTDMRFSEEQQVHLDYLDQGTAALDDPPYHVQPADGERITFLNARIPRRMKIIDNATGTAEVLAFSDQGRIAGYVPEDKSKSRFQFLALMSDGSYRLLDKVDNEVNLSPAGDFVGMIPSARHRMVKSLLDGNQRVQFTYFLDGSGRIQVASAELRDSTDTRAHAVRYEYDEENRLARVVKEEPDRVGWLPDSLAHPAVVARR